MQIGLRRDGHGKVSADVLLQVPKYIFLLFIVVISTFPFIWVLLSSFKNSSQIFESALQLPLHFSFDSYVRALRLAPIETSFVNSTIIAIVSTIINVLVIGMAAYVIARYEFKFKAIVVLILYTSLLVPGQAISFPIYKTVQILGILDSKAALIYVYTALGLPVTLFILRSYFLTIPREIAEAAEMDGSGFIRTFVRIMLPIARPGMFTAAILQFLFSWNEFFFGLLLTSAPGNRTLPVALSFFTSQFSSDYPAMFAALVIVIMPTIFVYVLLQEQIVSSLTAGAVK